MQHKQQKTSYFFVVFFFAFGGFLFDTPPTSTHPPQPPLVSRRPFSRTRDDELREISNDSCQVFRDLVCDSLQEFVRINKARVGGGASSVSPTAPKEARSSGAS